MKSINTLEEYQELAQRTTSTTEEFTRDKLISRLGIEGHDDLSYILDSLREMSDSGSTATELKSKIFYGKVKNVELFGPCMYNHEESRERLYDLNPKILHSALGLLSEAGELIEHILAHIFKGEPLDLNHLKKELGDSAWFVTEGAIGIESTLKDVAETNIEKLSLRYPGKFTVEDAVARKDEVTEDSPNLPKRACLEPICECVINPHRNNDNNHGTI